MRKLPANKLPDYKVLSDRYEMLSPTQHEYNGVDVWWNNEWRECGPEAVATGYQQFTSTNIIDRILGAPVYHPVVIWRIKHMRVGVANHH